MASMLTRFAKKPAAPKKTLQDHAEDALYREVNEEVHAEAAYDFVKKHSRILIAAAALAIVVVSGLQLLRMHNARTLRQSAAAYESAVMMMESGNTAAAREALVRAARQSGGGMADLALFSAAKLDLQTGNIEDGLVRLEQLAKDGNTRDFRDLALINLAVIKATDMTAGQFARHLAPVQTKRSPFYYTGMLLIAQKYLASGDDASARKWLDRITSDKDAPASISAQAEMLK